MLQISMPPHADRQKYLHRVYSLLTATILLISFAACLAVLAYYRTASGLALVLAQVTAVLSTLLHLTVMLMMARLVAGASAVWLRLRAGGKRTAESKQLRGAILGAAGVTVLMLPLVIAVAVIPLSLHMMLRVPEIGQVFVLLIGTLLMQRINIRRACQRLVEAACAAQQAAQRTLVA